MTINKLYLAIALTATTLSGCVKDEYEAPNSNTDLMWVVSGDAANANPYVVSVNRCLSFMDLSQGALSHEWSINSDEGVYYITEKDLASDITDYSLFADLSMPNKTSEKAISLVFTEPGMHKVNLRNTFAKKASYEYYDYAYETDYKCTLTTELINGVHTFDHSFEVECYNSTLEPASEIYLSLEDMEAGVNAVETGVNEDGSYKELTISYGSTLYIKDASTYKPNQFKWWCVGAGISDIKTTSPVDYCEMSFNKMTADNDGAPFVITQTVERIDTESQFVPTAPAASAFVPLNINVISSNEPLSIKSVAVNATAADKNEIIVMLNNGPFDAASIEDADPSHFSLEINNTYGSYEAAPYNATITATEVSIDEKNNNALIITFGDDEDEDDEVNKIFNTDKLLLTHKPETGATDAVTGSADRELTLDAVEVSTNLVDIFSQETVAPGMDPNNYPQDEVLGHWSWLSSTPGTISIINDPTNTSSKCMKIESITGGTSTVICDLTFDAPEGFYSFTADYYIPTGGDVNTTSAWAYFKPLVVSESFGAYDGNSDLNAPAFVYGFPHVGAPWLSKGSPDVAYDSWKSMGDRVLATKTYLAANMDSTPPTENYPSIALGKPLQVPFYSKGGKNLKLAFVCSAYYGTIYVRNIKLVNAEARP